MIDLGDRVLVVGRVKGSGLSSGAAVDSEWADLFTVSAGRVIREQVFFDHAEGLEAAGVSEYLEHAVDFDPCMRSMEPALEIDDLKKVYPTGVEALKGTSLRIDRASSSASWDRTVPASRR